MVASGISETKEDRIFLRINTIGLILFSFVIMYPLLFVVSASISDPDFVNTGKVVLFPKGLNLDGYIQVLKEGDVWVGYKNTIIYTVVGVLFNLTFILTTAYSLARSDKIKGSGIITFILTFTMIFSGGLIPSYMLIKSLGMVNTLWVMVLPPAVSVYLIIVTRTFISSTIPKDLYDSAEIDGAGYTWIFINIVLPLSGAIIAVIALFSGVNHWNAFFNALIYITDEARYPLQLVLRDILIANKAIAQNDAVLSTLTAEQMEEMEKLAKIAESMKFSLIIISSAPVLAVYPFLQKYFVRGVMIGSLKG